MNVLFSEFQSWTWMYRRASWHITCILNTETHWLDTSLTFISMNRHAWNVIRHKPHIYRNVQECIAATHLDWNVRLNHPWHSQHWSSLIRHLHINEAYIMATHLDWNVGWAILDIPNTETHWLDTSLTFISMYRHVSLQHTWVRMWGWATLVIPNTETHWLDTNLTFISMYRHAWNMIRHQPHIGNVQACIAAIHGLECEPDPPLTFPTLTLTD